MDAAAVERALAAFCADVRRTFTAELGRVRGATGSRSAYEANSKFEGFEGSFASLKEFHAGAEASLNLGYPNPDTRKGILNEHTAHPSVARLFVAPNYRLATCLLIEHSWAVDPSAPSQAVLDLLARLRADRGVEEDEERYYTAMLAAGVSLSLVRGESKDVDIDAASGTVTFRCARLATAAGEPFAFGEG